MNQDSNKNSQKTMRTKEIIQIEDDYSTIKISRSKKTPAILDTISPKQSPINMHTTTSRKVTFRVLPNPAKAGAS